MRLFRFAQFSPEKKKQNKTPKHFMGGSMSDVCARLTSKPGDRFLAGRFVEEK